MSGNTDLLKDIVGDITAGTQRPETRTRPRYMSERNNALSDITSGNIEDKAYLWVDPAVCKPWKHHNRRYDLLTEAKCSDLIEGIKSQGRQEIPAIVRAISGGSTIKYEVIAGARRHWAISWLRANNYPEFQYLIDVQDMTDEEAFRLADMENRSRTDISDYERSLDYQKAIALYYGGVASRMAERIGYTNSNLSYLLKLADLPKEVVDAFVDVTEITVNHGRKLSPLLKDGKMRELLLAKANELASEQSIKKVKGEQILSGNEIMLLLTASTKDETVKQEQTYSNSEGVTLFSVTRTTKKSLKININKEADTDELKEAFNQFIEEHY